LICDRHIKPRYEDGSEHYPYCSHVKNSSDNPMTPNQFIDFYISKLETRRNQMKSYLQLKVDEEDFHGVQDAASDLRDIDSEMRALETVKKNG